MASNNKKYTPQEVVAEVEAFKERRRNRIRKRNKQGLQFTIVTAAIAFMFWCTMNQTEDQIMLDRFNNTCRSVKDGESLEAVRGLASERQLIFDEDSGSAGYTADPVYVLRPSTDWPERFGCRFEARQARVYRLK
ncbi:MAG: hypothetical protein HY074_06310 [Deltaproteobacteria bacterium]|nr:hypothetical protein [Deltaproteobacteria bacterium]